MFPYLDLAGFKARTIMPVGDVNMLEQLAPGWIVQAIASRSSYLNGRFRKRYGRTNVLPFGQTPPNLLQSDPTSPVVTLSGRPTLGSVQPLILITTAGALGVAVFKWSLDNGVTFTTGVLTAASVPLASGLTASFAAGTYATTHQYSAAPPVPEAVLRWLTTLVTDDAYRKRGRNPQDPSQVDLKEDVTRVYDELREAADSNTGLFDLPVSEDLDTAIVTGGPLGYTETSPYAWMDIQRDAGRANDCSETGDSFP